MGLGGNGWAVRPAVTMFPAWPTMMLAGVGCPLADGDTRQATREAKAFGR